METTPFDLTPEQQGLLVALAQETGKPIPALIAEALDALQAQVRATQAQHPGHGNQPSPLKKKHIWDIAAALVAEIPEEVLARLPIDGAAQHDHYIYGTPKRTQ